MYRRVVQKCTVGFYYEAPIFFQWNGEDRYTLVLLFDPVVSGEKLHEQQKTQKKKQYFRKHSYLWSVSVCVTWWVSKPPFPSELLSQWADIRLGVTNKASIVITLSHERTIHILHKQSFTIIDSQMYKILCNTQLWTVTFNQTNSCVMKRCLNSWCEIPLPSISAH